MKREVKASVTIRKVGVESVFYICADRSIDALCALHAAI